MSAKFPRGGGGAGSFLAGSLLAINVSKLLRHRSRPFEDLEYENAWMKKHTCTVILLISS